MLDQDPANETAQVRDRVRRPPGVLPKNIQAWVILGIALVMVIVLAVSGSKAPRPDLSRTVPRTASVVDPNEARIQEYRNRIEEDARKLAEEQERLRRAQAAVEAGPTQVGPELTDTPAAPRPRPYEDREARPEKSAVERDRERREYESLFASNIALTYRHVENAGKGAGGGPGQPMAALPQNPYGPDPAPLPGPPASQPRPQAAGKPRMGAAAAAEAAVTEARQPVYRIREGTVLEAVLTNRLGGSFSGPVNCMVTTDVYS